MSKARRPLLQHRWFRWLIMLGLWTFFGLFDAFQSYGLVCLLDRPISLHELLVLSLAEWYVWAALAPLVAAVGQRYSLGQGRWPVRLAVLLASSAFFAAFKVALDFPLELALRVPYTPAADAQSPLLFFQFLLMARYTGYLLICWAILCSVHAFEYYEKFRRREREAVQLEAELARAQLQVLKMQLQPHFLFNTLNAISALVHRDADLADRMIARLGDLLRLTLENVGQQEVCLQQELEFVELYVEIEKARLGPRLGIAFDIDPDARDANVPNLILQPLVENAVRHAVAPFARPGRIEIAARRHDGRLRLEVRDDGPGLPRDKFHEGVGLSNTRARLTHLYGPAHRFEMTAGPGGGLAVILTLPYRPAADGGEDVPLESLADGPGSHDEAPSVSERV